MVARRLVILLSIVALLAATCGRQEIFGQPDVIVREAPVVKIHLGKHWVWFARQDQFEKYKPDIECFYEYADNAFKYLRQAWGLKLPQGRYALLVWPKTGGGFATGDIAEVRPVTGKPTAGIGISYDAFFNEVHGTKGYWGYVLITHEMVNLFTGQIVSSGWPVDWWANHRSPFPAMTAVQIEYALVPEVAIHHEVQFKKDKLYQMFKQLKDQFGWSLFRRAFAAAKEDGINWEHIGQNPSALRTNYVCAYLQLAAPEDLGFYFKEGSVPNFEAKMVTDILKARQAWCNLKLKEPKRKVLQEAFLRGEFPKILARDLK